MHGKSALTVRVAERSDRAQLLDLFRNVFSQSRSEEEWRWKYDDSPSGTVSIVAELNGRLIAHCGGIHLPFREHRKKVLATVMVDVMTSKDTGVGLGRGLMFRRLIRAYFDACRHDRSYLMYGFPSQRHFAAGERIVGYKALGPIHEFAAAPEQETFQPEPLSRRAIANFSRQGAAAVAWTRDSRSLEWRYLERPGTEYHFVEARTMLRRAAAIVRILPEAAYVMELGGTAGGSAWSELVRRLRALGKEVRVWCPAEHEAGRALAASGFRGSPRPHPLAVLWLGRNDAETGSRFAPGSGTAREFYYSLGDYDVY